jgi:hypothetical protein
MANVNNAVKLVEHVKIGLKIVQVAKRTDILKIINAKNALLLKVALVARTKKFVLNV